MARKSNSTTLRQRSREELAIDTFRYMIRKLLDVGADSHCTFFTADGLCELHALGLKPTEGRLSHHSIRIDNFRASKSVSWAVVQEWLSPDNADTVAEVTRRYGEYMKQKEH